MKIEALNIKLDLITKQRNIISILFVILLLANAILSFLLLNQEKKVIILPSKMSGKYEVSQKSVNDIFLIDKANDVITNILNITPETLENSHQNLLNDIPRRNHPIIKEQLRKTAKEVRTRKVSTAFYPLQTIVDTKTLEAKIEGQLYTFYGNVFKQERKNYHLTFSYDGANLMLQKFIIIKNKNEK